MPLFISPNSEAPIQRKRTRHRVWGLREATVDALGNHHADAGTPIGGQFIAKPKTGVSGGGAASGGSKSPLATSGVASAAALGGGVNTSLMVTLEDGTKAVYKPEIGEAWAKDFANRDINRYITNRQLSLAEREAMAYEVDQLLGTDLVPETVLRETLGVDVESIEPSDDDEEDEGIDEDYLRERYDSYRQQADENAMDAVGEEMGALFADAQVEHVENIKERAEEIAEIWNELIDEHPEYEDENQYGTKTAIADHPVLPLEGTLRKFQRQHVGGEVDPLEVIAEADVDVDGRMSPNERDRVRAVLDRELRGGASELLDVDEERARDNLDYGEWIEGHADTEARALADKVQDFDDWVQEQGYDLDDIQRGARRASNPVRNRQAPHPEGGSLQRFVPNLASYGDLDDTPNAYYRFAVLDYAIGSMDRHPHNVMYSSGTAIGIDNGYSFPAYSEPTFRSYPVREWMGASYGESGKPRRITPEPVRTDLLQKLNTTDWEGFTARHPSMSGNEQAAFLKRIDNLKQALTTPTGLYDLWFRQAKM